MHVLAQAALKSWMHIKVALGMGQVELRNMLQTIYEIDNVPSALRYPRGSALGVEKVMRTRAPRDEHTCASRCAHMRFVMSEHSPRDAHPSPS